MVGLAEVPDVAKHILEGKIRGRVVVDVNMKATKHWPNAKPEDFIFPTEKLVFRGAGAAELGVMTAYDVDPGKPLGAWKRAWSTAKKQAGVECRIHDLRHHFISALAQTQTPDATIQAISGHLSRKMLDPCSPGGEAARCRSTGRDVEAVRAVGGLWGHETQEIASWSPQKSHSDVLENQFWCGNLA